MLSTLTLVFLCMLKLALVQPVALDAPVISVLMRAHEDLIDLFSLLHVLLCVCLESVGLRNKLLRKVEELKSNSVCMGIPDEFLCPITRELMREPVIAAGKIKIKPLPQ